MRTSPSAHDWVDVALGDVFDISSSKRVLQSQWRKAGVPFYRAREIVKLARDGEVDNELFISEQLFFELSRFGVPRAGDLLVSAVGTLGACYVVQHGDRFYFKDASVLRLTAKRPVDSKFVQHLFRTPQLMDQVTAGSGSTVGTLTIDRARNLRIALPPLAEQRRIAEILDKADALRAKRRAALAQLDSLTQSIFLDMFGDPVRNNRHWPRVPLGSLVESIDSGWSPLCLARPAAGDEWGVLKLGAVTWCEYDASENKALPSNVAGDPTIEVKAGDILFTRKNTYDLVGACAVVRSTAPRLMMSDLIFRLRLLAGAGINGDFLQQLLTYPSKRREVQKLAGGSAGSMPNISKGRLSRLSIELPSLALQDEFARKVSAVQSARNAQRAAGLAFDALFASLQHRAFRGEL